MKSQYPISEFLFFVSAFCCSAFATQIPSQAEIRTPQEDELIAFVVGDDGKPWP